MMGHHALVLLGMLLLPCVKMNSFFSETIKSVILCYTSRSPIVLLSQEGFQNVDAMTWREIQPFGHSNLSKRIGLEWTWFIFNNLSSMPIRSNYHMSPKVASSVFTRRVNPRIKLVVWLNTNKFDQLKHLKYVAQYDLDIFAFVGSKSVLEDFFKSQGLAIRHKFGVSNQTTINIQYLVHPPVFNGGLMKTSETVPLFCPRCINLNGYSLKVSANTLAPYIMYQKSGEITGGTHFMMLDYAATNYNMTLTWDIGLTRGSGKLITNDSADGMLGDVLSGKADIAFISRLVKGQVGVIDLTECNSIDTLVFLTRSPEARLAWAAVIHIFTLNAWGLMLISYIAVIPVFYLSTKLHRKLKTRQLHGHVNRFSYERLSYQSGRGMRNNMSNFEHLYIACNIPFGLTFSQSIKGIPVQAYLISIFWMIFILNINTCYNSNLSSYLTSLTSDSIPQDFEELAQRFDYNITFNYLNNGACDCFHFFNESKSPTIIKIRERFLPNLESDTGQCVLAAVLKQKSACIGWSSVTSMGIAKNATLYEGLNLVAVSKRIHISLNSIGLQKHCIHTRSFSRFISAFRDMGIVTKLKENAESHERGLGKGYIHNNKDSDIYKILHNLELEKTTKVRPFDIENFSLSFLLLVFGLGISLLVFVLEKLRNRSRIVHIIM